MNIAPFRMIPFSTPAPRLPRAVIVAVITALCSVVVGAADWTAIQGGRWSPVKPLGAARAGFTTMEPVETGLVFTNGAADERTVTRRSLLNGSGVALGDVDADGWVDVYVCGLDSGNRLFRNQGGLKFSENTGQDLLRCMGDDSCAAAFADLDGDGDLDLLVGTLGHGIRCFLNDGKGQFSEGTAAAGLQSRHSSVALALADIDGDGDLDLFVGNYRPDTVHDRRTTQFTIRNQEGRQVVIAVDGVPTTTPELTNRFEVDMTGQVVEHSEECELFLNNGRGSFERASFTDGRFLDEDGKPLKETPRDWTLTARFHDFTGDGSPDLYCCNDLHSDDRIWVNDGRGRFRAMARTAVRHTPSFSMGVDFGDLNRDGFPDFMVVDMVSRDLRSRKVQMAGVSPSWTGVGEYMNRPQYSMNALQMNRGDGTFAELSRYAGVECSEWSWQPVFLDVDLDGYEDILIPNGMLRDFQNMDMVKRIETEVAARPVSVAELVKLYQEFPPLNSTNLAFWNRRDGTFEERGVSWGFAHSVISQGMALGDLDGDGDLDVVVNNFGSAALLLRNDSPAGRLGVRLHGAGANTRGVGARIQVKGASVQQSQEMMAGGRYASADDFQRTFAAGNPGTLLDVDVVWRSGKRTTVRGVPANSVLEVAEEGAVDLAKPAPAGSAASATGPLFEDVSARLHHRHAENVFDEYARQFLLPWVLSTPGPGVSWIDVDRDGREDLAIGAGRGGPLALYRNEGQGRFAPWTNAAVALPQPRDTTAVLPLPRGTNTPLLLVGSSNYEDGGTNGAIVRACDPVRGRWFESFPGQIASAGALALGDVDRDGDLDLFVGGRVIPGHYPAPAYSMIFLNEGGRFRLDTRNEHLLAGLGLVTSAVFADMDLDGNQDLVVASEWGPIRVLGNTDGVFEDRTKLAGLDGFTGWWRGVAVGDFDGNGFPDIVAANWGLNSRYQASPESPRRIYYGPFSGDQFPAIIESCMDPLTGAFVPERDLRIMGMGIPVLMEKYTTHAAYARATVQEALGDLFSQAASVQATTLRSMVFLRRPAGYEARPLPVEAQWAPACGVCVADFNADGREDVFLSQNFFGGQPMLARGDAGRGLLLLGEGNGDFRSVSGQESGLLIYGEQRGAAVADFDQDGRTDLVVGQNGAETMLYRNTAARRGLRVRLLGSDNNPNAVGAVIRLRSGGNYGPSRFVTAGSGWLSCNGAEQVLGYLEAEAPTAIQVIWPGLRVEQVDVPKDAAEITLRSSR